MLYFRNSWFAAPLMLWTNTIFSCYQFFSPSGFLVASFSRVVGLFGISFKTQKLKEILWKKRQCNVFYFRNSWFAAPLMLWISTIFSCYQSFFPSEFLVASFSRVVGLFGISFKTQKLKEILWKKRQCNVFYFRNSWFAAPLMLWINTIFSCYQSFFPSGFLVAFFSRVVGLFGIGFKTQKLEEILWKKIKCW